MADIMRDSQYSEPWETFEGLSSLISPNLTHLKHMRTVLSEENLNLFLSKIRGVYYAMVPDLKPYLPPSKVLALQKVSWKCSLKYLKQGPKKMLFLPSHIPTRTFFGLCIDLYAYLVKWYNDNQNRDKKIPDGVLWQRLKIISHLNNTLLKFELRTDEKLVINGLGVYRNNNNKLAKIIFICGKQTIVECDTYAEKWNDFFKTKTQTVDISGFDYNVPLAVKHVGWLLHVKEIIWDKYNIQSFDSISITWVDDSVTKIELDHISNLNVRKVGVSVLDYCWKQILYLMDILKTRQETKTTD